MLSEYTIYLYISKNILHNVLKCIVLYCIGHWKVYHMVKADV